MPFLIYKKKKNWMGIDSFNPVDLWNSSFWIRNTFGWISIFFGMVCVGSWFYIVPAGLDFQVDPSFCDTQCSCSHVYSPCSLTSLLRKVWDMCRYRYRYRLGCPDFTQVGNNNFDPAIDNIEIMGNPEFNSFPIYFSIPARGLNYMKEKSQNRIFQI